jgi:acylphosphatase
LDGRPKRVRLRIEGVVQGVFFRAGTRREAVSLGVRGFVRNLDDGAVEAVAEGEASAVDRLVEWCRRGPEGALVTDVHVTTEAFTGEFADFRVTG